MVDYSYLLNKPPDRDPTDHQTPTETLSYSLIVYVQGRINGSDWICHPGIGHLI
jgi:hypothetical protein